jgi:hypothetical protein
LLNGSLSNVTSSTIFYPLWNVCFSEEAVNSVLGCTESNIVGFFKFLGKLGSVSNEFESLINTEMQKMTLNFP